MKASSGANDYSPSFGRHRTIKMINTFAQTCFEVHTIKPEIIRVERLLDVDQVIARDKLK